MVRKVYLGKNFVLRRPQSFTPINEQDEQPTTTPTNDVAENETTL
jgi:hypothetical protein